MEIIFIPMVIVFLSGSLVSGKQGCWPFPVSDRAPCEDSENTTPDECRDKGCCFDDSIQGVPSCFKKVLDPEYIISEEELSWQDARKACFKENADLVTINNENENEKIKKLLEGKEENYWIGLNDIKVEGSHVWASNGLKDPKFRDWCLGEPNNLKAEDCVEMRWVSNGAEMCRYKWNDLDCKTPNRYICKKKKFYSVPIMHTTRSNIVVLGDQEKKFAVNLCGGSLYNNHEASVAIQTPRMKWDVENEYYLKVTVYDMQGNAIKNNNEIVEGYSDPQPVPNFKFLYKSSYGDLLIKAKASSYSSITYSLAIDFKQRLLAPSFPAQLRSKMNAEEKKFSGQADQSLIPVLMIDEPSVVKTKQMKRFQLNYCFPHGQAAVDDVTIATIADNKTSGMMTYVCPHSNLPCETLHDAKKSKIYDISGVAVNFVHFKIKEDKNRGPIRVLVVGDGRFDEKNAFTLASALKRQSVSKESGKRERDEF